MKTISLKMSLLFLLGLFCVASAGVIFVRDNTLDGFLCLNNDVVFKKYNLSEIACSAVCAGKLSCRSIFYQPLSRECTGCTKTYSNGGTLNLLAGSKYSKETYKYMGCYVNYGDNRILQDVFIYNETMTTKMCYHICITNQKRLMLTEARNWCHCGNQLPMNATKTSDSACDTTCGGDTTEKCGGNWRGSVYDTMLYAP